MVTEWSRSSHKAVEFQPQNGPIGLRVMFGSFVAVLLLKCTKRPQAEISATKWPTWLDTMAHVAPGLVNAVLLIKRAKRL